MARAISSTKTFGFHMPPQGPRVLGGIFIIVILLVVGTNLASFVDRAYTLRGTVEGVDYELLRLTNGRTIQIAGIHIPRPNEPNYREALSANISNLLRDQNIHYRIVEHKKSTYPHTDLATVYPGNGKTAINELLLKDGMAFFDHGYYHGCARYERIEKEARKARRGIWNDPDIKPVFIRNKYEPHFHFSACPVTQNIPEKEGVYYYTIPPPIYRYHSLASNCRYCRSIAHTLQVKH